ncbi:MAG: hypothetical protein JKY31_02000 [Rhodobacteraceae bacterium]|nr:hypothetical protein [Paracoccaceae bacterium]
MTPAEIKILQALSEQKKTRDMAELTKKQRDLNQIDTVINSLVDKVVAETNDFSLENMAVTNRWLGWADQEKSRLQRARIDFQIAAEAARKIAAHSDAKTRVIGDLLTKAEANALLDQRRHAEQMGQEPDK